MSLVNIISKILIKNPEGLTPKEIKEIIKTSYAEYYATESHLRNVDKGHYKDVDHALLAQIYTASQGGRFDVDRSQRPVKLSISQNLDSSDDVVEEFIENEDLERLEAGIGTLYILGTNLFTKEGKEIVKIGITTGDIETRIGQLYTTGVPFRFHILKTIETTDYYELEQSIHKLLKPYRINRAREFFTDDCLPHVTQIIALHEEIKKTANYVR